MKKIIIAIDAEKPDRQSIAFGCYLAGLNGSGLTGVFLEDLPAENKTGLKFAYGGAYVETIGSGDLPETGIKERTLAENIRSFKTVCEEHGVSWRVHRDQGVAVKELIAESRYADVIIIGAKVFALSPLEIPSDIVKTLLAGSECPVLIAPHHTEPVRKILFAYDGGASAVFAIKQFTALFPELKNAAMVVLQANEKGTFDEQLKEKLYEYLRENYRQIDFKDLYGRPEDELFDYTLHQRNACLVMGAYGRNWLSRLFRESTAEMAIKINQLPVFIAHR